MKICSDVWGESVAWAVSEIKRGKIANGRIYADGMEIIWQPSGKTITPDDFEVRHSSKGIVIKSGSERSFVYGLLEIAEQQKNEAKKNVARNFQFKTRNYKHEIVFPERDRGKTIGDYSMDFWESFCRELTRRNFNGIVFYGPLHPFPHLIDYREFPEAAILSPEEVRKNRDAFNMLLSTAKKYNLRTFIQNYATEFTSHLARSLNLPFQVYGQTRLSNLRTGEVMEYSRYCYREIFNACPDLSGLYMNFESAPNAFDFLEEAVFQVYNKFKNKPVLVLRVWDMTIPEKAAKAVSKYDGELIISHKITDSADTYYYPCADSRLTEWRKRIKGREFMYIFGPCHNSGTNLSEFLWTDPEYIYTILRDAKRKGADSISFHSVTDLLSDTMDDNTFLSKESREFAWMNYFHMETAVKFFQNERFDEARWIAYYKAHFKVSDAEAPLLYRAMMESSQIVPLVFQQFFHTSAHEANQVAGRFNFIQEPFFYFPCSYLNNQSEQDVRLHSAWLVKRSKARVCPDTFQWIIDFANPAVKKRSNNPRVIAEKLQKNAESSLQIIKENFKNTKEEKFKRLLYYAEVNHIIGMWVSEEIRAGISFYRCYFTKSREDFIENFKEGLEHLRRCKKYLDADKKKSNLARQVHVNYGQHYDICAYIQMLEKFLATFDGLDFPFAAFKRFVDSRAQYNEIRRYLRPDQLHSEKNLKRARADLKKSLSSAEYCIKELEGDPSHEKLRANAVSWRDSLVYELKRLGGEEMSCGATESQCLGTDHGFRSGDHFYTDFDGFFNRYDYTKTVDAVRFNVFREKKSLRVVVEQAGCNTEGLEKIWDKNIGIGCEQWFLRFLIDPDNAGKRALFLTVAPRGRYFLKRMVELGHTAYMSMDQMEARCKAIYSQTHSSWKLNIEIPYAVIGKTPGKQAVWGFNVLTNIRMATKSNAIWRAQYESFRFSNLRMLGKLRFASVARGGNSCAATF